ncbi:MAG TPA: hypothetical protein PLM07_07820 [Candidatus Rifleibacterium sp.]|nr:hypothetical protein [Candidatus Rifleibacterium sp.]HPT45793.1 hypothetical protein [Candidatus Rifleibacterium sp.]
MRAVFLMLRNLFPGLLCFNTRTRRTGKPEGFVSFSHRVIALFCVHDRKKAIGGFIVDIVFNQVIFYL